MLVVAFFVGSRLAIYEAKRHNLNPDIVFNLSFITFLCGIIGSRLLYIIENISYYLKRPLEIIMLQRGGLSWFGGLILAIACATLYLRRKKLSVYKIFDLIAPFLALAQAIGRLGCLLNGCCFGRTIIPLQIYSSLMLILIFIILRWLQDRPYKKGEIFFTYLLLYSVKRFFIEFWRLDNPIIFLGLTLFQIISIIVFCLSVFKILSIHRAKA